MFKKYSNQNTSSKDASNASSACCAFDLILAVIGAVVFTVSIFICNIISAVLGLIIIGLIIIRIRTSDNMIAKSQAKSA